MGLSKIILNIALKIVDILTFYIRPKKNHITFISLTQSELSSDFKLIDKQLRHENKYDIHYILLMFEKNLWGDFKYFLNCLKQLVEIKKSSLVILNDNNYVISHMKPKNVKVLQIWHACGAVKKFGNQIKRQYPVQNYDYVLCNAEYWKDPYSQAFNVKKDQVLVTGMPRIDTLLNLNGKDEFYLKYPELKDKKLCLYAPTFRGNIIDGFKIQSFDFTKIKDYIVQELLPNEQEVALEFIDYLKDKNTTFYRDNSECWKNKIYYWAKLDNWCVCFIAIHDPEESDNHWTVWSDDMN